MNGAATNPYFPAVACAGTQIKNAIDACIALGGENYVFWGGREGYMSLLNTNMKREKDHLAMMLTMEYEARERPSGDDAYDGARLCPQAGFQRHVPC